MHASSPARLIITSGARDSTLSHAASGDLSRADSEAQRAQHAQRIPSISVVTASEPADPASAAEGVLHWQRQGSPQHRGTASPSGHMPGRSDNQSLAEVQMLSPYAQRYGLALPQQHAQEGASAQLVPAPGQPPGSPFPARVDSLSGWARHNEGQRRSNSPQSNAYAAGQQPGSFEFDQGQYVHQG